MSSPRHIWREAVSGIATGAAADTEGGRAFFQERLGIWARVGFLLTFTFLVLGVLLPLLGVGAFSPVPVLLLHSTVVIVWGAAWFALRRRPFSPVVLGVIDAGIVLVGCSLTVVYVLLEEPLNRSTYLPSLIVFIGSVGRAIFVPSTAARTFWVSSGIAALVELIGLRFAPPADPFPQPLQGEMRIWSFIFSASAVVLATVASRVIYGLRQEVRKALQLGQYTLEEKLGEGGMGMVYRARHALLRRPTAVKLLPLEKAGEASLKRFEREVQLTALLSHPNTVAIFDYGRTPDGIFYYAMEYLDGVDLECLVKEDGPQPPGRVVHILGQVCGSLGEAHDAGLIHRDIKPANVILCQRGGASDVAKVVDFGLVKGLEQADGVTKAETITGTPYYLAPEAIRGSAADPRSDLYAVGAVGYYLLTGHNVFEGSTLVEICGHHLHSPPVPLSRRLGREIPEQLEAVILSCLEKDPGRRPQSAPELRRRLAACEDVGPWTEEQAREWWAEHGPMPGRSGPAASEAEGLLEPSLDTSRP